MGLAGFGIAAAGAGMSLMIVPKRETRSELGTGLKGLIFNGLPRVTPGLMGFCFGNSMPEWDCGNKPISAFDSMGYKAVPVWHPT
jgi:hypothetical protein